MLCCAIAAYVFSQIYAAFLVVMERLTGRKAAKQTSGAAIWTLGDVMDGGSSPRRHGLDSHKPMSS